MEQKSPGLRVWRQYSSLAMQVLTDVVLINAAYVAALYLRYEKAVPILVMRRFVNVWPFLTLFCILGLWATRAYKTLWRYAGSNDVFRIAFGTMAGVGCTYLFAIIACAIQRNNVQVPFFEYLAGLILNTVRQIRPNNFLHGKVIYAIAWLIMFLLITARCFGIRLISQAGVRRRAIRRSQVRRVMIVGAGWAGAAAIRELIEGGYREGVPSVMVDDNPDKAGTRIMGVPIELNTNKIPDYVKKYGITDIVIAIPSASAARMRELLQICVDTDCKLRIVTAMRDVTDGQNEISPMRDVNITDLLCRDEVRLEMDSIREYLTGKVVLVTGGGGSIGSELCRQIASFAPSRLAILDIYENNAYELERELKSKYGDKLNLTVLIGSVRDEVRLEQVMRHVKPQVIFHAAAHKHVPLMEDSPAEAVKNNIFGTLNVARAADRHGVSRMVILSTDKAVNPTNVMGATKRVAELVVQYMAHHSKTRYMAVRFGNVLGSNGSVIPLFKNQIAQGGPVTVTHPDITRFFMTIPEAAQLVLQAGAIGESGNIFVLDMGTPVKIVDLARNLIRLAGYEPDVDIKIEFCGLRPGEKLYEELTMTEEQEKLHTTCHDKIMVLEPVVIDEAAFLSGLERLKSEAMLEDGDIRMPLKALVPSFVQENHEEVYAPSGTG